MRTLLALMALSAALVAQREDLPPAAAHLAFRGVWLDQPGPEPVLRARGEDWKMEFAGGVATFYPRLRARAERHWPVAFRLAAAAAGAQPMRLDQPRLERGGERQVRVQHGPVTEVWDLAADHVEQSFVLASPPGPGDLVLEVECATELAPAAAAGGGLMFSAPGGGGVWCGDAVAFDAAGRRCPLGLEWRAGRMRLQVPAAFLHDAVWPVVVDPVVRTVAVASSSGVLARPRAAYDATFDVWLVVCEDEVTVTDTDILVFRLAQDGTVLDSSAVELGPGRAISPDVGAIGTNGQFLLGWLLQGSAQVARRLRNAGNASYGLQVTAPAAAALAGTSRLAIGGARTGDLALLAYTTPFFVGETVWAHAVDVHNNAGPVTSVTGGSSGVLALEIADRTGPGADWGLVAGIGNASQFFGVQAGPVVGPLTVSPMLQITPGGADSRVAGSGPWVVAAFAAASPPVVVAAHVRAGLNHAFVVDFNANLTALEGHLGPVSNRRDLALASDGCRYVYSYREDHPTTPTATVLNTIRVASLLTSSTFAFDERRAGVGRVGPEPSLCAAGATGGPAGMYLLLEAETGSPSNLSAIRYDGRQGGDLFTVVPTSCGSPFAPLIGASGLSVLGGSYVVQLARPVGVPVLLAGFPEAPPVPVCGPNPACRAGVRLPALVSMVATALPVTVPCDAGLLGMTLAFQGIDVLGPGGCPAGVFGFDLRLSDTVVATVR